MQKIVAANPAAFPRHETMLRPDPGSGSQAKSHEGYRTAATVFVDLPWDFSCKKGSGRTLNLLEAVRVYPTAVQHNAAHALSVAHSQPA